MIEFEGWRTQDELKPYFERAPIFILASVRSSRKEAEGQGLVLPEGMLNGESGYLVPEKDPVSLAEAIVRLLQEPETWPELGRTGRRYVEQEYDLEIRNDALVLLYQTMAAREPLPVAL